MSIVSLLANEWDFLLSSVRPNLSVDNASRVGRRTSVLPQRRETIVETREVARRVEADIEDVLGTVPLVAANPGLTDRLFDQLVDLLLESMLVELRAQLAHGAINPRQYGEELSRLADQCRAVGLLPRV
jgi:hypothetical protein